MNGITAITLSLAWTVAITATLVWDRGPVEAVMLAMLRTRQRPAALACYLCAAWWVAPPVALACALITGEPAACAAGAGLAIAGMWWSLPAHARMSPPARAAPRSGRRCCGSNTTRNTHQEAGL